MQRRFGSEYLIRMYEERQVRIEPEDESQSLKQMLQSSRPQGYLSMKLQRFPRRESREAILSGSNAILWGKIKKSLTATITSVPKIYSGLAIVVKAS